VPVFRMLYRTISPRNKGCIVGSTQWNQVTAVILAAGNGQRMKECGIDSPKVLLPVLDQAVLVRQVKHLYKVGCEHFVVVNNIKDEEEIENAVARGVWRGGEESGQMSGASLVQYVQQKPLGITDALLTAAKEEWFKKPFLTVLGDIWFMPRMEAFKNMLATLEEHKAAAVIVTSREENPDRVKDNFAVYTSADGSVQRVEEKPENPNTDLKGVGVYLFAPTVWQFFEKEQPADLTEALQMLIDNGHTVMHSECVQADVNINTPADLWRANMTAMTLLPEQKPEGYSAFNAIVHSGVSMRNCAVMIGSEVLGTGSMENCVVLPHTGIRLDGETVKNSLIGLGYHLQVDEEDEE